MLNKFFIDDGFSIIAGTIVVTGDLNVEVDPEKFDKEIPNNLLFKAYIEKAIATTDDTREHRGESINAIIGNSSMYLAVINNAGKLLNAIIPEAVGLLVSSILPVVEKELHLHSRYQALHMIDIPILKIALPAIPEQEAPWKLDGKTKNYLNRCRDFKPVKIIKIQRKRFSGRCS